MEPDLNSAVSGDVLGLEQREQLLTWLKNNKTGHARIRAGVPLDWKVGDKTGGGVYGVTNDIGIFYPRDSKPIIVVIFYA